jgi:hypothetical protein
MLGKVPSGSMGLNFLTMMNWVFGNVMVIIGVENLGQKNDMQEGRIL